VPFFLFFGILSGLWVNIYMFRDASIRQIEIRWENVPRCNRAISKIMHGDKGKEGQGGARRGEEG
jgi:hypothetical protein